VTADVRIVATREEYAERFNALIDKTARERRYIGFVEGLPSTAREPSCDVSSMEAAFSSWP
jgi:hypothetical protein